MSTDIGTPSQTEEDAPPSIIDPETTMGVVSLSVGDLQRSLDYYQHIIGLVVLSSAPGSATLGVGKLPLLRLHEVRGARVIRRATGLYHFALRVPTRHDLARVIVHLAETRAPIGGASDHQVSEALYLSDPDGHGIEIYRDRPRSDWYDDQGMFTWKKNANLIVQPMDIDSVLSELRADEPAWQGLPLGTDMGHVHLQVADVAAAERFYVDVLGFERMMAFPSASFIAAGGYHHHIGLNSWAGAGVPAPPEGAAQLLSYEIRLPSAQALENVLERVRAARLVLTQQDQGWAVRDPSHNLVMLTSQAGSERP